MFAASPRKRQESLGGVRGRAASIPQEDLYIREPVSPAQRIMKDRAKRQEPEEDLCDMLGDLFTTNQDEATKATEESPTATLTVNAFSKQGLTISIELVEASESPQGKDTVLKATFNNDTMHPMHNFIFEAAPPQGGLIQLQPASGSTIPSRGTLTQLFKVRRPVGALLRLMIRGSYRHGVQNLSYQEIAENFPGF